MSRGTIVIAAHNEERVIGRTLTALSPVAREGTIRIVVVCNGCTDRTAEIVKSFQDVHLAELAIASKTAALREGDRRAAPGPRIYLDADVVLTARAARDVMASLDGGAIAGRPPHRFDTDAASWVVRRWYRTREALPSINSALWGAGCYGLSTQARARFDEFPDLISDDLFIHELVSPGEILIVETDPVIVRTPRRTADLLRILRRSYRSQSEVMPDSRGLSGGQKSQLSDLAQVLRTSPARIVDVAAYAAVIVIARAQARFGRDRPRWERDLSSRAGR